MGGVNKKKVEENFTLSLKFARQCAERKNPYCYYSLGRHYSKGDAVKQDYKEEIGLDLVRPIGPKK